MLAPVFSVKLKHKIHPRTVTIGKYDGSHSCLSCGTTASKVLIHNPHKPTVAGGRVAVNDSDVSLLNVNQSVTALCAGRLDASMNRDMLCIGSPTNLLAYDVHDNKDLFYKEVPDGVNSVVIGRISKVDCPIAIAGGNCTLIGFDSGGNDRFWTVTGDVVGALALADFTNDGQKELLVGSEDFEIRAFRYDEIIAEMSETEAVTGLCPMGGSVYGYALANGTVGVYDRASRNWRIKSKNQALTIHSYDIDGDGVTELISGWSNGKIDARSKESGEIIFKDTMTSAVAGLVDADYRLEGKKQLICCSVDGEIRGYQGFDHSKMKLVDTSRMNEDFKDLSLLKQNLLLELQNYEMASQTIRQDDADVATAKRMEEAAIPVNTQVDISLTCVVKGTPCLQLIASTNNDTVVRMVVIFAEGLFEEESHVAHPAASLVSTKLCVPLYPTKDIPVELHAQIFVSPPGSTHCHVFERALNLPRFSSYIHTKVLSKDPESSVTFQVNERVQRVAIWFNDNFLLMNEMICETSLDLCFIAIRGGDFNFHMEGSGQITIKTDNIDLAGDLIQSLASFLRLEHLQVIANFPVHIKKLSEIMSSVDNLHSVTQRLAAEMTDHSNLIRSLVVRAEDARLQDDFAAMRKGYMELNELNRDLIGGYHVRSTNHDELVKSLKLVNQIIQKAAHLRVGKYKTQLVAQCRDAIKNNNVTALKKIIQAGCA